MDEHLAEFIASSLLTATMTYANRRLSAEMRLPGKKGDAHNQNGRWKKRRMEG